MVRGHRVEKEDRPYDKGADCYFGVICAILASSHRGILWEIVRESVLHGDDALEGEVLGSPSKWDPPRQELEQAAAKRPQIRALDDEGTRYKCGGTRTLLATGRRWEKGRSCPVRDGSRR